MDEIVRAKSAMDQTCWLRFLTDFKLLPSLVSMSEAKHVFSKYNFYLTPHKWDLRTDLHAPQSRPIGMAGATQFRTLSFSDFVAALLGITFTRASLFTVFPTKEQRVLALCCYMRKQAVDWNESLEVTRARDRETHSINSGDSKGRFLEHGKSTPSCLLKLQRMWGDHQTEYNWWLDYTTPESAAFEHRLSDKMRSSMPDGYWIAIEIVEILCSKAVKGLHTIQPIQVELPEENEDGDGGDGEFDSDDEMVRGGGDGDWDSGSQAREKTPAYVERLYSPRTPPTWPKEVRLLLPLLLFLLLVVVVP
jgi:hypothetical protein